MVLKVRNILFFFSSFSVLFHQEDDRPKKLQLVDAMAACLGGMSDEETAYRLIIGLGTLVNKNNLYCVGAVNI